MARVSKCTPAWSASTPRQAKERRCVTKPNCELARLQRAQKVLLAVREVSSACGTDRKSALLESRQASARQGGGNGVLYHSAERGLNMCAALASHHVG
jgi:hypothetical protein